MLSGHSCDDANKVCGVVSLLSIINALGVCQDCPEDINSDGQVDVIDILFVAGAWGECEKLFSENIL